MNSLFARLRDWFGSRKPKALSAVVQSGAIADQKGAGTATLTVEAYQKLLEGRLDELSQKLARSSSGDLPSVELELEEVKRRLNSLYQSYQEMLQRVADIEDLLVEVSDSVSWDRIRSARDALSELDLSKAEEIFSEIQQDQEVEVNFAAEAAFGLGEVAATEGRLLDAAKQYELAASLEPSYRNVLAAGNLLFASGNIRGALETFENLVAVSKQEFGLESVNTSRAMNNLAEVLIAIGRYEEAESNIREAIETDSKVLGLSHPEYAKDLNTLARLLSATGRYEEAEPLYREALEISRETLGERHPQFAGSLNNLAALIQATGRFEVAEPLFREAAEITRETLGARHPDYASSLNNLALLLKETGRFEAAEPLFREAGEITRETLGARHPDYATRLNNLAELLRETGRFEAAEPLYREAVEIFEATLGAAHPSTQTVRQNLETFLTERDGA